MKNLCKKLFLAALAVPLLGLYSCGKDEGRTLNGTFVFREVYDMVLYMSNGVSVSARATGELEEEMATGQGEALNDLLVNISYKFEGEACYMTMYGVTMQGTYTLSDSDRLTMNFPGLTLPIKYVEDPAGHMFILDVETLKATGGDVSQLNELGAENIEYWLLMKKQ